MDSRPPQTGNMSERVGFSLSGGGIRALTFHLGVIKFLAEFGIWEHVKVVSSVSGGSLAVGLMIALNRGIWPSSEDFLGMLDERAKETLTRVDLEWAIVRKLLSRPWMS